MNNYGLQIEELVTEIKRLREKNDKLFKENNVLKNQINSKDYLLAESKNNLEKMESTVANLKEEIGILKKKEGMKIKKLENELRKNELFRESFRGTSKTRQEEMIRKKIKLLKNNNRILMDLINLFSKKFDFEPELCKSLCDISNTIEDTVIKNFLEGILSINNKNKDE